MRDSGSALARLCSFSSAGVGFSPSRPAPQLPGSEGACSTLWARFSAPGSSARGLSRVCQNAVLARVCLAPGCLGRRRRLPAWRTVTARSGLGYSVRLSTLSGWSVRPGWSALSNLTGAPPAAPLRADFGNRKVELRRPRKSRGFFAQNSLIFCAIISREVLKQNLQKKHAKNSVR